jgi:hypothetical protein
MNRAHGAGGRKCGLCQCASQIVGRIAVVTGKTWASQADDSFRLSRRYVHGEQFSGEPEIDGAPVDGGKTMANTPTLHPTPIDTCGSLSRHGRWIAQVQATTDHIGRGRRRLSYDRLQHILSRAGHDGTCFNDSDPRSRPKNGATLGLLIGEACQSSQVAPVRAGQVTAIGLSQLPAQGGCQLRFEASGAEANPSNVQRLTRGPRARLQI